MKAKQLSKAESAALAVKLVSDIGVLGYRLQACGDDEISEAVAFLRQVNPEIFDWIVKVLSASPAKAQA